MLLERWCFILEESCGEASCLRGCLPSTVELPGGTRVCEYYEFRWGVVVMQIAEMNID
jgi:hypothetical protein